MIQGRSSRDRLSRKEARSTTGPGVSREVSVCTCCRIESFFTEGESKVSRSPTFCGGLRRPPGENMLRVGDDGSLASRVFHSGKASPGAPYFSFRSLRAISVLFARVAS